MKNNRSVLLDYNSNFNYYFCGMTRLTKTGIKYRGSRMYLLLINP